MKRTNLKWKAWPAMIVILIMIGGIVNGLTARAESATPSDLEVFDGEESYWLDEIEGRVILDDPIYFMDFADDEMTDEPTEEALKESELATDGLESTPPDTPASEATAIPWNSPQPKTPTGQPPLTPAPDVTDAQTPVPDTTKAPTAPTEEPTSTSTEQPTQKPTEAPVDLKALFHVSVRVPSGWRNASSAVVRIKISPAGEQMWHSVRYHLGNGAWETVPDRDFVLYDGYYYADVEVSGNAQMTIRLFGDEENYFDTSASIRIFDRAMPEVTAGFRDLVLHVEATDDLSGVAGIQVNSLLFTTLVDGMLDVRMEEPLNAYQQLAIRAYDYAGNFSDPVTLDNPYYAKPTQKPTAKPAAKPTAKPTKKPSGNSGSGMKATATPMATATPLPAPLVTQQPQIVYATPDPLLYPYPQSVATAIPETVYVPLGPGQPYKSEGNMQTLDMLYSASTNKQFITVQTRAGETYYLVIDYDKPIDEDNDIYETYFLNLVDDRDLLSVVSEDEIQPTPTPQVVYVTPEPTSVPQQAAPIVVEGSGMEGLAPVLLLVVGIAAVGGAVFWFLKIKKGRNDRSVPVFDEYDVEDEDESNES